MRTPSPNALEAKAAVLVGSDTEALQAANALAEAGVRIEAIPIDLYPRSFQPFDAAQTPARHVAIILWRLDDAEGLPVFEMAVPRSYFPSLRESLYL